MTAINRRRATAVAYDASHRLLPASHISDTSLNSGASYPTGKVPTTICLNLFISTLYFWLILSYILPMVWAFFLLSICLSGAERGVSLLSIHKKRTGHEIFSKQLPRCLKGSDLLRMPHGCITTLGNGNRRKGLQIYPQGSWLAYNLVGVSFLIPSHCLLFLSSLQPANTRTVYRLFQHQLFLPDSYHKVSRPNDTHDILLPAWPNKDLKICLEGLPDQTAMAD